MEINDRLRNIAHIDSIKFGCSDIKYFCINQMRKKKQKLLLFREN